MFVVPFVGDLSVANAPPASIVLALSSIPMLDKKDMM